jgi:hypothetical protein
LLVGGSLGLAMLFRTQSMFMLPAVLLLALFACRWKWGRWLRAVGLLALGLALVIAPYLWRNWTVTGRLAFDDDKSQTGAMAQRYSLSGTDESLVYQPGEDPEAYSRRITRSIFGFLREHPGVVARFVSGHWLNAEIANLLVLPVRSGIADVRELWMPLRPTWQDWKGTLTFWQALLFAANAGLVALGIGACWTRAGWAGLAPLLANLSYNFSNALARNSGGRYLLVADWVMLLYAAVGLVEISIAVLGVLGVSPGRIAPLLARREEPMETAIIGSRSRGRGWLAGAGIGLAFLLVGSLPGLAERAIPPRYPEQSRSALVEEALRDEALQRAGLGRSTPQGLALERFAGQSGGLVVKGRALYPRYYDRGQGEPQTAKTGYEPLDYARTVFVVASPAYNGLTILKAQGAPKFFPNAADVIIIGCPVGNHLDARLVLVLDSPGGAYAADAGFPERCPGED